MCQLHYLQFWVISTTNAVNFSNLFYTTIGQYPTLYNFLAITQDELILWEYHLDNPNTCDTLNIFQPTLLPGIFSNLHYYQHHCTWGDVASHA